MRKTALGYPVLSEDLHERIFGLEKPQEMSRLAKQKAENLLKGFNIATPVDYPEHLYDGPLPLPELQGENLQEHFEKIALDQIGSYKTLAEDFAQCKLPELPPVLELVFQPGWTRYTKVRGKWKTEAVPYPLEEAFTYDTETYVHGGAFNLC
jgi:DNA polymerase gamma 1